jgi:hypothetical protein
MPDRMRAEFHTPDAIVHIATLTAAPEPGDAVLIDDSPYRVENVVHLVPRQEIRVVLESDAEPSEGAEILDPWSGWRTYARQERGAA